MPDYDSPYPLMADDPYADRLRQSPEGHAYLASATSPSRLGLEAPPTLESLRPAQSTAMAPIEAAKATPRGMGGSKKEKKLTPEQLMMMANLMQAQMERDYAAAMSRPPAVQDALDRSAR